MSNVPDIITLLVFHATPSIIETLNQTHSEDETIQLAAKQFRIIYSSLIQRAGLIDHFNKAGAEFAVMTPSTPWIPLEAVTEEEAAEAFQSCKEATMKLLKGKEDSKEE